MASLHRTGVRIFNFHDDNFFMRRKAEMLARVRTFGRELERRKVTGIAFAVKSRPDTMDEEILRALKGLGLFRVFLGIEAGTVDSLAQLGRRQTLEQNERALELVDRLDLHACFNLLLLNPESTLEDLAGNVEFLRAHRKNPMNFCRTEVYAGTPLERRLRRQGRLKGDYWGRTYRIADERAQRAFEVMSLAFASRNYGADCLHHLTMKVDYEHQLLRHFRGTTKDLHRRVKGFVAEVNLNTCEHLDRLVVASGTDLRTNARRVEFARELGARVERDNVALSRLAWDLLSEIRRDASVGRPVERRWKRAAAAASIAASMGLTLGGCDAKNDRTPSRPGAPPSTASVSEPARGDRDGGEARPGATSGARVSRSDARVVTSEEAARAARPRFGRFFLPVLAERLGRAREVRVELWIDSDGQVSRTRVHAAKLDPVTRKQLETSARAQTIYEATAYGKHLIFTFTAQEIEDERNKRIETSHPFETIPRPAREDTTD